MSIQVTGINETSQLLLNLVARKNAKEIMERLALVGIQTASVTFAHAQYDGTNDVVVEPKPNWLDDHTLEIVASGQSVCFIEFGTGVVYPDNYPNKPSGLANRGTYGQGNAAKGWWVYPASNGYGTDGKIFYSGYGEKLRDRDLVFTVGNPPAKAMYYAKRDIEKEIIKVVKEVLKG